MSAFIPPPAPRPTVTYANCMVSELAGFRPLLLDLHLPEGDGPFPVLLWIHGGGWHWGSRTGLPDTVDSPAFYRSFLSRGIAVADVDYRLAREAQYPAQLTDVQAAIRWLRHYAADLKLDPARFAALGESAGAHIASMAGLTGTGDTALQAIVSWYGAADFSWIPQESTEGGIAALFGGAPATIPDFMRFGSPINQIHPDAPPFLLMHGTADDTVPSAESSRMAEALRAAGIRADLELVENAGHCFRGYQDIAGLVDISADFVVDVLK